MDGHGSINLQKHTIFKQRSCMVNVLLFLHVGGHILIKNLTYIELIVFKRIRRFFFCA
jgi:hypothetical protein